MPRPQWPSRKRLGGLLAALGFIAIAALTLIPDAYGARAASQTPIWCVSCGDFGTVDMVLNVCLFVPLGLGLGLLGVRRLRAMACVCALTVGVELLQYVAIAGRDAALGDVLMNSLGGWLGLVLAAHWPGLVVPSRDQARRLALGAVAIWLVTRVATVLLLQPSFPATVWYGQIAPMDVYPSNFRGRAGDAAVSGVTITTGALTQSADLRQRLQRSATIAMVNAVSAGPTPSLASVVSILDEHQTEVIVLGQTGNDALFRVRLRAARARLRVPSIRLGNAMNPSDGKAVALRGELNGHALSLTAAGAADSKQVSIALGPGLTWALLTPFDPELTPDARWITALWTGSLLAITAYWWAKAFFLTGARPRSLFALAAVVALGLCIPPIAGPTEWLGSFLGVAAGGLAGAWRGTSRLPIPGVA